MILRFLATFVLALSIFTADVGAQTAGLNTLTDAQIQQYIQTDQALARQKTEEFYQYQNSGDQISANRTQQELDTVNARLRDYQRELERRRAIANNTATGSDNSGNNYTGGGGGAYGPGTTTTTTTNTTRSETTESNQGGNRYVWVPPENRGGIEAGHREYNNAQFSAGPGGVTSGYSRSSVTVNEDGSTVSESQFYKVGIQKTQNWVSTGSGGSNMPAPAENKEANNNYNDQYKKPTDLGLAEQGENVQYESSDDGENRETKDSPDGATVEGVETPDFKDPGECDGGTIFCGIGLKEGANFTGEKLDEGDVGITTNVDMRKLIIGWVKFFLALIAVVAVITLIYAGILMIVHMGDDSQIEKAKKIIIWAVVGIILVFLAFAIVNTLTILGDPNSTTSGSGGSSQIPVIKTKTLA